MNDYRHIFQKRAKDYHFAIHKYPNARTHEFENLISSTDFSNIEHILDIPSGGSYLKNYLPNNLDITSADFSEGFTNEGIKLVSPEKLSFATNTFDAIFSLSGMHHLDDVSLFVEECLRILKNEGTFVFADVKKDTPVDVFLNEFVNTYNSLGHKGDFFNENFFEKHKNIQNKIIDCTYNEYPFLFNNKNEMTEFFKLFFGLDKANDKIIENGIRDILGIKDTDNGLEVNWGLLTFKLKK